MSDHRTYVDRLISICFGALAAATALYVAVRLIEAVWAALLVILAAASFIAIVVRVLRTQRNGW